MPGKYHLERLDVKVIMTTALDDPPDVVRAIYQGGATSYLVKPIGKKNLLAEIEKLGLELKNNV